MLQCVFETIAHISERLVFSLAVKTQHSKKRLLYEPVQLKNLRLGLKTFKRLSSFRSIVKLNSSQSAHTLKRLTLHLHLRASSHLDHLSHFFSPSSTAQRAHSNAIIGPGSHQGDFWVEKNTQKKVQLVFFLHDCCAFSLPGHNWKG